MSDPTRRPSVKLTGTPVGGASSFGGGGEEVSITPKQGLERRPSVKTTGTPVGGGGSAASEALYGSPNKPTDTKSPTGK